MRHIKSPEYEMNDFQRTLVEHMSNGEYTDLIYLMGATPFGKSNLDVIITDFGLCIIQYIDIAIEMLEVYASKMSAIIEGTTANIYKKLAEHRGLTYKDGANIQVKMPFTFKQVFRLFESGAVEGKIDPSFLKQCYFKGDEAELIHSLSSVEFVENAQYPYWKDFKSISEQEKGVIILILAPEYAAAIPNDTTYVKINQGESINVNMALSYKITLGDVYANAFCLDPEQIHYSNLVSNGHWFVDAFAGSGKSVMLLSIALRFARNPNNKTLILCRNRNLAGTYDWKISQSGLRYRNLQCYHVHRFCQYILTLAKESFNPAEFDLNYEKALRVLSENKVDLSYTVILIDEMQILRDKYYKLFSYFISRASVVCLFGDTDQDVNNNVLNKKYPWEVVKQLDFVDNFIKLTKNYRNTVNIAHYADGFLDLCKFYYEKLGIQENVFDQNRVGGIAFKPGIDPLICTCTMQNEVQSVISLLIKMNESTPLSEIAVLFPARHNKIIQYELLKTLQSELKKAKILYTEIINSENVIASKVGIEKGVVLATIDSVLGLDFKSVIVCGLSMFGIYNNSKQLTLESININEKCKEEFYLCCNKLYVAMTRARERLDIIITEPSEKNIYSKLIIQAMKLKARREEASSDA